MTGRAWRNPARHNPAYSHAAFLFFNFMKKPFVTHKTLSIRLRRCFIRLWWYWTSGVWNETESNWRVDLVKTVNLSVRSFMDKNLQQKAAALTFSTMLALVPTLAMIFFFFFGFGFQNLIESEVFNFVPVQKEALTNVFTFVDSYLAQSSEGIFVGVGILFLMWTLVSLLSGVEDTFNHIWGVNKGRNFYRKVTDYIAIFLIIPVLIICANGIKIFMLTVSSDTFLSPVVETLLDIAPSILTWLLFTLTFVLIPYTKVRLKYAIVSGFLCGMVFQLLQWLMISGQIYVSKYNAIYGSFAFLPLLLIWIHLSWLVCLSGVVLTYSSQNIFKFNFRDNINEISERYLTDVTIVVLAIIAKRFSQAKSPYTKLDITERYNIPIRLVGAVIDKLVDVKLVTGVTGKEDRVTAYQPAFDLERMTLKLVKERLHNSGKSGFIPSLDIKFGKMIDVIHTCNVDNVNDNYLIKNLPVNFNEKEI